MKNAKNTKIETKSEITLPNGDTVVPDEKIMTCADVARELKIDPKRARAFLRKNVALYVCRNQRFTKTSKLYTQTRDALLNYAKTRTVVTE